MPPFTSPAVSSTQTPAASLLATLSGNFDFSKVQDSLFSTLLASASLSAAPTSSNVDNAGTSQTVTQASDEADSGDDRAVLRTLLQRLRDDASALRSYSRKQDDAQKTASDRHDDTASASDTKAAVLRPAQGDKDKQNKTAADKDGVEKDDGTAKEVSRAASESAAETKTDSALTEIAAQLGADKSKMDQAPDTTDNADKATTSTAGMAALLNDFLRTEQAALSLLNKLGRAQSATAQADTTAQHQPTSVSTVAPDATALAELGKGAMSDLSALRATKDTGAQTGTDVVSATSGGDDAVAVFSAFHESVMTSGKGVTDAPTQHNNKGADATSVADKQIVSDGNTLQRPVATVASGVVERATTSSGIAGAEDLSVSSVTASGRGAEQTSLTPVAAQTRPESLYDAASQLSAARATRGGAAGLPSVVEQVAVALHKQVKDGQSEITVLLKPAELGKIEIKLTFAEDGSVQGKVVADNAATLGVLTKDAGNLQRALQEAGLRADPGCLQFSLRGDQQNPFAGGGGQNSYAGNGSSSSYGDGLWNSADADTMAGSDDVLTQWYVTPGRVNMKV